MAAPNHEETIRRAYANSLAQSGIPEHEIDGIVKNNINDFKRAEIAIFREDNEIVGTVPIEALANYVAQKYNATCGGTDLENSSALVLKFDGGIQDTNFPAFKEHWEMVVSSINLAPENDDDFAELKEFCKRCKDAEKETKNILNSALSGAAGLNETVSGVESVLKEMRRTRLAAEKVVGKAENAVKEKIIKDAEDSVRSFSERVKKYNKGKLDGINMLPDLAAIAQAAKRKKNINTMQEAVLSVAVDLKSAIEKKADLCLANLDMIEQSGFPDLFPDKVDLVQRSPDVVVSEISGRIAKHQLAEKEREEKQQQEEPTYSLEDFKAEAREKTNQWHLENWWKKHQDRAHRHLTEHEFTELAKDVVVLISQLKGDPPPPEEPPPEVQVAPAEKHQTDDGKPQEPFEEPEEFKLQLEFTLFSSKEQAMDVGNQVYALICGNPMLQGDITLRRI